MNTYRRRITMAMAAAPLCLGFASRANAQGKQLTIILTVTPGTASDILARLLGEKLRAKLNRPVMVESKPGAAGVLAVNYLKQLDAEGSALLLSPSSSISMHALFSNKPKFDPERDLIAVCEIASAPHAITVNASMGVNSFKDYLDQIRNNPKLRSIGTPSLAGLASLLVYQIRKFTNLDLQSVPYRGGQPLLTDLLGGQIPASASIMPDYLNEHRAGKLRVLAHASEKRSVLAPDIPTFMELGYPFHPAKTSFGLFAKSGTPAAFIAECASAATEALAAPEIVERLHQLGLEPVGGTPAEFQNKLTEDRTRWAPLIKESGMKID